MHEHYIDAGVDVITTNTYSSARHNLEPLGLGEHVAELNLRAVELARDARDAAAKDRPVYIAGSISNFGIITGSEWEQQGRRPRLHPHRSRLTETQIHDNLLEQAEILAEAGVDFMLAEPTGGTVHRGWVTEACLAVGLPTWTGFKCHLVDGNDEPQVGYTSKEPLADHFKRLSGLGGSVVTMFHSSVDATNAALPLIREHWSGPIAVYPESERSDYVAPHKLANVESAVTPDEFVAQAKQWVADGVQIIGGCCGVELEYIRPLREALPASLA